MAATTGPTTSGQPALEDTSSSSGAGVLPAANPPEIAKAGALLLAPVKVPIPISVATLVAPRAFLGALANTVGPPSLVVMLLVSVMMVRSVVVMLR